MTVSIFPNPFPSQIHKISLLYYAAFIIIIIIIMVVVLNIIIIECLELEGTHKDH